MLDFACDVLIDIPKFWEFLGEIVAPSLASGALRLAPFFEETTAALAKNTENSPDFSGERWRFQSKSPEVDRETQTGSYS